MKNLLTNSISTTVGFPVKSGTLDFLQNASSEMLIALARSIVGKDYSASTPYALYGCNNLGSGSTYDIQAGLILWNGVLYLINGGYISSLPSGSDVYLTKYTSYIISPVADPVTFTDGVSRNVHSDTTMLVSYSPTAPLPTVGFAYSDLVLFWKMPYVSVPSYGTDVVSGTAKYKINRDGLVSLSGNVTLDATTPTTTTLFTLPVGYQPINDIWLPIFAKSSTTSVIASLKIDTAGVVILQAASGTVANFNSHVVYLNGVSFYNI
jgi:hypothetical protein